MKTLNKVFLYVILVLTCCYGSVWVFNHINAWVGIILSILVVIASINAFDGMFINKKKE